MPANILLTAFLGTVCVVAGVLGTTVKAAPSTTLSMTITPLQCDIEVVDDGFQTVAYTDSATCHKVLKKDYPLHLL